ncbi:hypothetical protein JYB88_04585 [Shewanella cyperi]|uniref:Big-1 domain-containing protein n=1 Tax=Shewanella cyperi TaxID=2814292 RepID=A0A974XMA1_9GAMM|nr:hypothetical protein [Shewanella cyperi]QSX30929.1 hypothetical protein JYB88_04585 [Shewanella cyperi]
MKPVYQLLTALVLSIFLIACGGGDGETPCPPNTPCDLLEQPDPGSETTLNISLVLVDTNGNATQNVTATRPGKLIATVSGIDTATVVSFSTTIGELPITTAVTDVNGKASVDILAGTTLGAGTVTAKLDTGEFATTVVVIGASDLQMGSGNPFTSGVAAVSSAQLSAGGTASVSVVIQDANGTPFTDPAQVMFSSTCSQSSPTKAAFDTPIALVNGVATSTYLANGCVGDDPIMVTANVGGQNLSAVANINVLPANVGSIIFVSATPDIIGVKGSGMQETSEVVFQVMDTSGKTVANKTVNFALDTTAGGISLSQASAISNTQGLVKTVVNSGTEPTSVRVNASIAAQGSTPMITSQSRKIVISNGSPEISLTLVDGQGNAIPNVTATYPGKLVATVTGIDDPVIVTFSASLGELPIKTAVTDANGQASVDILAGTTLGAATATATLMTGETASTIVIVGVADVQMGSGTPFTESVAAVSLAQLSAGGTATVSVRLQDSNGNPFTEPAQVNFASTCSQLSPAKASLDTPVVLVNGMASSTYQAKGCEGDDPIRVTANVGGKNLSATASINVLPASVGSIVFVSVTPQLIGIKDAGLNETSSVVFKVMDIDSNPVANKTINFALNTSMGGISLSQSQAISDAQGMVHTVVNSGTTATTVRVTASIPATADSPEITSQSRELVISTGIPDQDSFTFYPEVLNPECWGYVGEIIPVHVRMADAFNNPPADGTAVNFNTEGGAIDASCLTVSGSCSVNFYCQHPIPTNGRSTVLATAIGEESFADINGNGRFDAGDENDAFLGINGYDGKDVEGKPYDLGEAFVDFNEDQLYNPEQTGGLPGGEEEELIDFNGNGHFEDKDGLYNGVLCAKDTNNQPHAGCANPDLGQSRSLNIREDFVIVMAGSKGVGSSIVITDSCQSGDPGCSLTVADNTNGTLDVELEAAGSVSLVISDVNNQQMPFGTKVTFSASVGEIITEDNYNWPSSNTPGGMRFGVAVKGETTPKSGTLVVETLTPHGVSTQVEVIPIVIH